MLTWVLFGGGFCHLYGNITCMKERVKCVKFTMLSLLPIIELTIPITEHGIKENSYGLDFNCLPKTHMPKAWSPGHVETGAWWMEA